MTDRPEDRPEERRRTGRTGPLGDDGEAEETRRDDPEATRQVPAEQFRRDPDEERTVVDESARSRRESRGETGEKETRVIRTPGAREDRQDTAAGYPRGYFEAAEEREARLRDMYGGVDWLASFLGCVFALVAAAFFSFVAGLVLVPLGFGLNLGGGQLGPAVVTGLVLVGVLIFLTYLFGGYVAGRLARFDGGRNGAMSVVWTLVLGVAVLVVAGLLGGLLPANVSEGLSNLIQGPVMGTVGNLSALGLIGLAIAVGALLLALLGGFLGGRLGSRYHREIDRTT